MRIRVKLCGVTDAAGVEAGVRAGVDALGFVFAASPRRVRPEVAAALCADVPRAIARVAVFRYPHPTEVREVLERFPADLVQSEPVPELDDLGPMVPVVHDGPDVEADVLAARRARGARAPIVLEGPGRGGRGVRADWSRAARLARGARLALAGGLSPANVAEAIGIVRPWAVDVSSGVETAPGIKDRQAVDGFVRAARDAALRIRRSS